MKVVARPAVACAAATALATVLLAVPVLAQIVFQPVVTYPTPGSTFDAEMGDFTGDWIPDLITATRNNRTLAVFPGKGDGTFGAAISKQMPNDSRALTAGDVNGDGKLDAVVVTFDANMLVYLGAGNGTFGDPAIYPTERVPQAVVLGDFSGDGKLDAAVGHGGSTNIRVYPNQGNGTFGAPAVFLVGPAFDLATADMNSDGKLDLIVGQDSSPTVVLGRGDGSFNPPIYKPIGYWVQSVAIADYNRDGRLDVVSACGASNKVDILLGNGDGSLGNPQAVPTPMSTVTARAGDLNQDGRQDIVVTSAGTALTVLHGRGDGTFDPFQQITLFPADGMVLADLNHDLRLDVASFDSNNAQIGVLLAVLPTSSTTTPAARKK